MQISSAQKLAMLNHPRSRGCFPNVNNQDSDFSDKERNIPSRAADIRSCSPKLELLLKKNNSEEGWVKRAKMELVSMCQQLVKAMCQFVKAVMCRVSTDSTGTRPFEGFAQGLRRQSGNDNVNDKDNYNDNCNGNDN